MKIAWIGMGIMGRAMANRLLEYGHTIYAYTRTPQKIENINHKNLFKCPTINDAVRNAELVITMLGFPSDVKDVYLNEKNGLLNILQPNSICIDMTTSDPELAKIIANNDKNISVLDAPVTGGEVGAKTGGLSIMVGGNESTFNSVVEILNILGTKVLYLGPSGNGQYAKLANQILVASNTIMTAEILNYCMDNGIESITALEFLAETSSSNWQNRNNGIRMIDNDFHPGFYNKHFIKDLNMIKENTNKKLYMVNNTLMGYHKFINDDPTNNLLGTQSIFKLYRRNKGDF